MLDIPSSDLILGRLNQKILLAAFLKQAALLHELDLAIGAILDVAFERAWGRDGNPGTADSVAREWAREVFTFQRFPDLRELQTLQGVVHSWMQVMSELWDFTVPYPSGRGAAWERYCRHCTTLSERLQCSHARQEGRESPKLII